MAEFLSITFVILLSAISPGPDFALIIKNALQYTRKMGVFTALGIACSLFIHSIYCILGLAIIISHSLFLFTLIKYMGACYLIYLGTKGLLEKRRDISELKTAIIQQKITVLKSFLQGFLCNLLNPKAIFFLLAFFTLIIDTSSSWLAQFGYAIEITVINFVWFSCLSIMITNRRIKENLGKIEYYIIKIMGLVLIGFGLSIAVLHAV